MSDDQDGCELVSVSSGTGLPGLSRTKAVKRLCVCVFSSASRELLLCDTPQQVRVRSVRTCLPRCCLIAAASGE